MVSETLSKRLKKCPFCNGESEMYVTEHVPRGHDHTPRCKDPSCAGRLSKKWMNPEVAIAAWNRRVG